MGKIKVDYIIIGQGLAGSWLAYEMIKRGLSIIIFDENIESTSSKKAAGIYNPITGRNMIKTWRADDLFSSLESDYSELERLLNSRFLYRIPIYRPFKKIEDQNDWDGKAADNGYQKFLKEFRKNSIGYEQINDPLGGIILNESGYVDIPMLLKSMKSFLLNKGAYRSEVFDYDEMSLNQDTVRYNDIEAKKLIFCEGTLPRNPYWNLPFRPVRGEIMDIKCELKSEFIINQGIFMIPKKNYFTVGSTYDHKNLTFTPQDSGILNLEERLQKLFTGNYQILDKRAGVRPATHDRKPYIGLHEKYKTLGIFNGFGTKGVSLAPHFAKHFVDVLQNKIEIDREIDVQRAL